MARTISLTLVALALALFAQVRPGQPVIAQDEAPKSKATDRRPINDQMTLDEARKLIEPAAAGDEEALQKLTEGRLAYLPVLLGDRRLHKLAYTLMYEEIGWVRDMQRWEAVLRGIDTGLMQSTYDELKDRFVRPDGQLARVYIKAYELGDFDAARAFAKRDPEAPLLLAAQAWEGEIADLQKRVTLLLDSLESPNYAGEWNLEFAPGLIDERARRMGYASDRYINAEVQLYTQPEGEREIFSSPHEWGNGHFFERLGMLVHDLPQKDREAATARLVKIIGERHSRLPQFNYAANFGNPSADFEVQPRAMITASSVITLRYAKTALKDQDLPRRLAAVSVFWGAPDWTPAQDFLLQEAASACDPQFMLIAIRAVLVVNDDRLRAVNSVARVLKAAGTEGERKAFVAALKSLKNARLDEVATALEGKGALPSDTGNPALNLDRAGKAALIRAFMSDDEVKAYGGVEPAYLMNLSQFLYARHSAISATHAAFQGIELAARTNKRRLGQTNACLTHMTLKHVVEAKSLGTWLDAWQKQYPVAVGMLRNCIKAADQPTEDIESAVYAVNRQNHGGEKATNGQVAALIDDCSLAGGYGVHAAGFTFAGTARRGELYAEAERITPTDYHLYQRMLPTADWFGRYWFRDWSIAEHVTQCLCLLRPFSWTTLARLGSLLAKTGSDGRCVSPLLFQAGDRPIEPYQGFADPRDLARMLFNRHAVARLLRRNSTSGYETTPAHLREVYLESLSVTNWGREWQDTFDWAALSSNRPGYARSCADNEYANRDTQDVNFLLNLALEAKGTVPDLAVSLVADAEAIGVSDYGRFVGSQSYIQAQAHLGNFDAAFKRWEEFRDGDVGYPPYLDKMLLHGMAQGNQYQHLDKALDAIAKFERELDDTSYRYALRRAFMACGRHGVVASIDPPEWMPKTRDAFNLLNYTEVFFEARRLLETGKAAELHARSRAYWKAGNDLEIGVVVDFMLIRALTGKLNPETTTEFSPDAQGMLHAIPEADFLWFVPSRVLDYRVIEILVGKHQPADLPQISASSTWHGLKYSERPQAYQGAGFLSEGEGLARDRYIRGVLAFLADDMKTARAELEACVKADQRFSYEYHVAEWLLDKQIPKK
jgi:hypothetical protein